MNIGKDKSRRGKRQHPRDGSARCGVKRSYKLKDEQPELKQKKECFYGCKAHASLNGHSDLITSPVHTAANAADGKPLWRLLRKDLAQGLPVGIVAADRGYEDSDNHWLLWDQGIHSALCLNYYRIKKKDPHKDI